MLLGLAILGFFILGILFGFYAYRGICEYMSRSRFGHGVCGSCGNEAYVVECRRCRLHFAMCHYYAVLGTDNVDPAKLRRRRGITVCEVCLSATERETLEKLLGS